MKKVNFIVLTSLQVAMLVFLPQCSKIDEGIDQFRIFREDAIFQINNSSQAISAGIGDLNTNLENLNRNLPAQLQKTLSFDVPYIISTAKAEAAEAGLCFLDAAASKALYLLELMKSELITGEKVPFPDPLICSSTPGSINLNQDKNQRDIPYFSGYNLFLDRKFTAFLYRANGDSIPVATGRPNNYRVAANLSDLDDQTLENFKYLSLNYEGKSLASLFVVKKHAVPPATKLITTERPVQLSVYPSIANSGDVHFWDDTRVTTSVQFGNDNKRAWVEMTVTMEELDWSENVNPKTYIIAKSERNYYYAAPEKWHIKNISGGQQVFTHDAYNDITGNTDIRYILFGELKIEAKNTVVGSNTSVVLNFSNDVPSILIEEDN